MQTRKIVIAGQVQGVGFRPFVYRTAADLGVHGWVRNTSGRVEILAQAGGDVLKQFVQLLVDNAPPLARPTLIADDAVIEAPLIAFTIESSDEQTERDIHVPPDHFACGECRRELRDAKDRRFRYPFINCTQCGPRYTIIDRLPYDRPNTSMSVFPLCDACRHEYENPLDRRFHAEPVACAACGPSLTFIGAAGRIEETDAALAAAVTLLRAGGVVAARGIGGYHLLCDARDDVAVSMLRVRKHRPHKPLAVMVPQTGADGCDGARAMAHPGAEELVLLQDPRRVIVLCRKRDDSGLAESIAPGLDEVGIFLPYSPLHDLLLDAFDGPLVATSGNISGEPVLTEPADAEQRLGNIVDGFLHHNRPIRRPADDAVYRIINAQPRPLRIGRGTAPLERRLPLTLSQPVLAVGGHMKNTVALAWSDRVVVSPHIGDLDSPRSLQIFEQVIADLQELYGVRAEQVVCDAHPDYASARWARASGLPCREVFHHHAHAAAVAGEFACDEDVLVFTWDGTGYGDDGTLWGGEGLLGRSGQWRRVSSFRPFRLPGGDKAGREPWRAAAALCWEIDAEPRYLPADVALARGAWERDVNCPQSSAVGRLFDAAASLTEVCQVASFEGQGPMLLEAAARGRTNTDAGALPMEKDAHGCWRADWAPLITTLSDTTRSPATRAVDFHHTLAATLCAVALRVRDTSGIRQVGLSGGVFQNRLLGELAVARLHKHGFSVLFPETIPCNDAGIAYGQIVEAAAMKA